MSSSATGSRRAKRPPPSESRDRWSRPPGTTHDYSNLNFCLLGLLVADVTGRSYEAAATELLLRPLGITGMRLVSTVDPNPDEVVHASGAQRTYMESLGGAGAWVATPSDMVRILDALDPGTPGWHPLSPELSMIMRQALDVAYPEPQERRYGLGIIVWPDGSWGHTGSVENTHTMLVRRPDGVTWCILVSGDVPESTESLREVFDAAFGESGVGAALAEPFRAGHNSSPVIIRSMYGDDAGTKPNWE